MSFESQGPLMVISGRTFGMSSVCGEVPLTYPTISTFIMVFKSLFLILAYKRSEMANDLTLSNRSIMDCPQRSLKWLNLSLEAQAEK